MYLGILGFSVRGYDQMCVGWGTVLCTWYQVFGHRFPKVRNALLVSKDLSPYPLRLTEHSDLGIRPSFSQRRQNHLQPQCLITGSSAAERGTGVHGFLYRWDPGRPFSDPVIRLGACGSVHCSHREGTYG